MTATFGLENNSDGWSLGLTSPSRTLLATQLADVVPLLEAAEAEAIAGSYVAVMLSYEAAPAFDYAFKTHTLHSLPFAWAAIFPDSTKLTPKCKANYSSTRVCAGLLAGTFRDQLLAEGKILERAITIEELREASEFFLIHSVHKWMRATVKSADFADSTDSSRGRSSRQEQKQKDPAF